MKQGTSAASWAGSKDQPPPLPHTLTTRDLLRMFRCGPQGLDQAEAEIRLQQVGPNTLPRKPPPGLAQIVMRQFKSPLIYLLALAAVVSLILQEYRDAGFIAAVLLINAIIGAFQESRAERASQALQGLLRIRAAVRRDDRIVDIDAERVVPGDIVYLESGNRVPADIRLLAAHGLQVDESLLTGESLPVTKDPGWMGPASTALADRINMVHAGSMVSRGRCHGVVVATGTASVIGKLALDVIRAEGGRPPLVERMERFTRKIAMAVLAAAATISVAGVVLGHFGIQEMFMFGVALAVSAIPEGLPVALTVALAIGTTRMARRGVIVRRLAAVEGLGSCTLIASDKTGTLTCNELTVHQVRLPDGRLFDVTGEGFAPIGGVTREGSPPGPEDLGDLYPLLRAVSLCNEAELHPRDGGWGWRGDPTDVALLTLAGKLGHTREDLLDRHPQVNDIPFEPERQYAASFHRIDDRVRTLVKGAPERVLAMCTHRANTRELLAEQARDMAEAGFRVLAVAEGPAPETLDATDLPPEPTGLSCLGLVGMIDPLRPGVREAVAEARRAGVASIMVTGDHPVTALAIARTLDLARDPAEVTTGEQLARASGEELARIMTATRVFARVGPHQKLEIVNAARAAGHFVAVTGDGVNDAPALRTANIGVAMGRSGTDVAREAAELVISDDHFATITAGIEEGRIAYDNIRNVIYLLISTGAAEVVLVILALASGSPIPLLPVQLLWLNLVTNGIQDVALAFEPGDSDVLSRPPRSPRESIFNRLMIERTIVAALVMGVIGFGLFHWSLQHGWSEASARNALLLLMVLFENTHIFNCRSETRSAFSLSPLKSPVLMAGMLCALSLHVTMLYLPWGNLMLSTEPVSTSLWLVIIGLSLPILLVMEFQKWFWRRRYGAASSGPRG
jgi:Ca2+-transporting ATPase